MQQGARIKNAWGMCVLGKVPTSICEAHENSTAHRTEIGVTAQSSRTSRVAGVPSETPCEDWEYMELAAVVKGLRAYVDGMPGVFELVIVVSVPLYTDSFAF